QMCYSSTDLIHWHNEGVILHHQVDANRIEVLYNEPTKKYVMILKYDTNGGFMGVATADKPEGPFSFKQAPVSHDEMRAMNDDRLKAAGPFYLIDKAVIGDMSVYKDDDGKAYLAYVSWAKGTNREHGLYLLSDDFTAPEKRLQLWDLGGREANHIFKRNGIYYYGTSRTAGIQSSGTSYYTTKDLASGNWSPAKPMPTPGSTNSWDSQVDFVYLVKGTQTTTYMFVGDRWTKDLPKGRNGDYIWLPLEFNGDDPVANYYQDWDLNVAAGTWRKFDPKRNLAAGKPVAASSETDAAPAKNVTAPKTWDTYIGMHWDSAPGDAQWVTVDLGTPTEINRVILKWNTNAAKSFKIQTSLDNTAWTDAFSTDLGSSYSVTDESFKTTSARYVRMSATARAAAPFGGRGGGRGGRGAGGGGAGRGAAGSQPAATGAVQPIVPLPAPGGYSLFDFEVLKD
ncbi:MAG TPA: discoidin domain-containing protein, partial [Phycisphaerae bacterium]|nr:discoidin domain-containing protein [Phycisphaerae bacterium]